MSTLSYKSYYRRNLPHIQLPDATLFVTFRLAGSIPQAALDHLRAEKERRERILSQIDDSAELERQRYKEHKRHFGNWDAVLDSVESGPLWLRDENIAKLVCDSMHHRDANVYDLDAFCVMPNHVHAVFTPLCRDDGAPQPLSKIMHSLKWFTALKANEILGRNGPFWQAESYDHVVRDEAEWQRIIRYVLYNPVKAGLAEDWRDWPWTYFKHLQTRP